MLSSKIDCYDFEALNYIEFKELQQSLNLNTNEKINEYIDGLLVKKCQNELDIHNISFMYKIYLFLHLMAYSVTFEKSLKDYRDGNIYNINLNLSDFIDAFDIPEKIIEKDNYKFELYPLSNNSFDSDDISNIVKTITIGNIDIDLRDIYGDVTELLDNLPGDVIKKLKIEIENYIKENTVKIFKLTSETGESFECCNTFSKNSIIDIIKFLFKEDLEQLYKNIYSITRNLGFKYSDFANITQSEMSIFINLYNEEVEKNSQKNNQNGIDASNVDLPG